MRLFGSSGIRDIVNEDLLNVIFRAANAVGTRYNRVVVGRDTRTSSDLLKNAAVAGLCISGARPFDAGLLPTPTLALAAHKFDCGLMITASHNPPEYNGVKLLNPDGSAFSPKQQSEIEELIKGPGPVMVPWDQLNNCATYHGAIEQHINHIHRYFPGSHKVKVVVDCACGAASVITPALFHTLGCEVLSLNSNPSGFFPHPVEPLKQNLGDLMSAVLTAKADLGVAHDGDADRMMGVDETGRYIDGDKMLCLLARANGANEIVSTIDASMALEKQGYQVERTPVGDSFVSEQLKTGGEFGGEPSGAWIFPKNTFCPDGIFAAACLVDIASRQKLSTLVDAIPDFPIQRSNITMNRNVILQHESEVIAIFNPAHVSRVDGLKLVFESGWILIRPSGTEPKVRITVEGQDQFWVQNMHDRVIQTLRGWE